MPDSIQREVFCAFLDLLGFKNTLTNWDQAVEIYDRIMARLVPGSAQMADRMIRLILPNTEPPRGPSRGPQSTDGVRWRVVSDSFTVTSGDFLKLRIHISCLMHLSLCEGHWFRGGIGFGRHIENEIDGSVFVISEALRDAYIAESSLANVARVVVHPRAMDAYEGVLGDSRKLIPDLSLWHCAIQDHEGVWSVPPMIYGPEDAAPLHDSIERALAKYAGSQFLPKYLWVADLYNFKAVLPHLRRNLCRLYYTGGEAYLSNLRENKEEYESLGLPLVETWRYAETYWRFFLVHSNISSRLSRSGYPSKSVFRSGFEENVDWYLSVLESL
jgi:hypothetical protein